jgi:hypothetical protein
LFDPRAGAEAVRITDGHGGIKGSRVVFLGDRDRIATTGVSIPKRRRLIVEVQQNVGSSGHPLGDRRHVKPGDYSP